VRPLAVDLFAGAGGLSLGFEQAGFDVAAAVEIDPVHSATHHFNFPKTAAICSKIEETTGEHIRKVSRIRDAEVAVVFGGPPCQGFSMIGYRSLDDPRNQLLVHFKRIVAELKPKYFVLENVSGLTHGNHRKMLDELIEDFKAIGYNIQLPYQVLNAAEFGVPQSRRRLFLLGARSDLPLPEYPQPTTRPAGLKKNKADSSLPVGPSVWDAIGDLPEVEQYIELLEQDWAFAKFGEPSNYVQVLRGERPDKSDFSARRVWDPELLTSSLRTVHTEASINRFAETPVGTTEEKSRLFKLDPEGVCNTLRAGTPSNRGAFTSPRPLHPYTARVITVREAARLHSYPDWFRFHVTKWHGFRQIGNSVPPLLGRSVAAQVMKAMGVTPVRPKSALALGDVGLISKTMKTAAELFEVDHHVIEPRWRDADAAREKLGLEKPSSLNRSSSNAEPNAEE
jgi:DNA (cytosine-5)-methyltransferase 1